MVLKVILPVRVIERQLELSEYHFAIPSFLPFALLAMQVPFELLFHIFVARLYLVLLILLLLQ